MSKQNSVEFLFEKLWDTPKDKFEWNSILGLVHLPSLEFHSVKSNLQGQNDAICNQRPWSPP